MASNNSISNRSEPLYVGNLKFEGNEITSTNINGDINITNPSVINQMTITKNSNGVSCLLRIRNTDNTDTGSNASLHLKIAGTTALQSGVVFGSYDLVDKVSLATIGSYSGNLTLFRDSSPAVAPLINFNTGGEVTKPLQPAFLAYNSSTDLNQIGVSATNVTVDFDTEVFDLNGDFSADTFTAPTTARFRFATSIVFTGIVASRKIKINFVTSNNNWYFNYVNALTATSGDGYLGLSGSALVDMDTADTCYVVANAQGEASDVIDIVGTGSPVTYFCGYLAT